MSVATVNPYANHTQLSALEAEVLWEYAKLGDKIKRISALTRSTAETPNEKLLSDLRALEKRMGLVLTLYKASVWGVIQESQAEAERAQAEQEAAQAAQAYEESPSYAWNASDEGQSY